MDSAFSVIYSKYYRGAKRMRNALIAAGLLAICSNMAMADDSGFSVYATMGQVRDSVDRTAMDKQVASPGPSSSNDNPATIKLQLAYNFDQNWAIEGGIVQSNNVTYTTAQGQLSRKYTIVNASVAGTLPLGNGFSGMGRLGIANTRIVVGGVINTVQFTGGSRTDPTFGIGLKYDINQNFSLRADLDNFNTETGRVNVWSLGGGYKY
jgi:hypothetical protein